MATGYEIAQACGVSASTVSYVLSGRGDEKRISPATQEKIRAAAAQLGHQRSVHVPARTPTIAVYWPEKLFEMCMPSVTNGINAALATEIMPVNISINPFDQGRLSSHRALWDNNDYTAVVIVAAGSEDLKYLETNPIKVPTVLLSRDLPNHSSVSVDHEEAGRIAALHAIRNGGSNVSLVQNSQSAALGLNTRGGHMYNTFIQNGIDMTSKVLFCENQIDDGYDLGRDMIRKNKLSRVILCSYDMVALGIISALNEAGIPIGDEVQVLATSSGPQRLFARCYPPMTVVDLRLEEVMQRALSLAIDLAMRRLDTIKKIVVPPTIVYRDSCPLNNFPHVMTD